MYWLEATTSSAEEQISHQTDLGPTLKVIHLKRGSEFIQLQHECFVDLQVASEISQELCQVIQQPVNVLKYYVKTLFQRAKQ